MDLWCGIHILIYIENVINTPGDLGYLQHLACKIKQ